MWRRKSLQVAFRGGVLRRLVSTAPSTRPTVELALDTKCILGEGPIWDPARQCLFFVDLKAGQLHVYRPPAGSEKATSHRIISFGSDPISTVVPAREGGLLIALQSGLYALDLVSEKIALIAAPEAHIRGNRFNDGKVDPAGRLWAGTMSEHAMRHNITKGSLYCLTDFRLEKKVTDVGVSNGLAWSDPDKAMYFIDTLTRRVDRFDYEPTSGEIAGRAPLITFPESFKGKFASDMVGGGGMPDGMTMDANGHLWVAHWGGGCVSQWRITTSAGGKPAGELLQAIRIPATNVTACWFGGLRLQDLYVTTAAQGEKDATAHPHAGGLFVVRNTGAQGVRATPFAGDLRRVFVRDGGRQAAAHAALEYINQVVIVTGGAQSIGRAISWAFAAQGAKVVCADANEKAGHALLTDALRAKLPGRIEFVHADFADPATCAAVTKKAVDTFGGIDILVNNVGVQTDDGIPADKLEEAMWDQVMNINLKSFFLMAKHCIPHMLQAGKGAIVNMASVQGLASQPGVPAYASSKGGILSLTRQLSMQYAGKGIRVNAVCPGTIETELVRRVYTPQQRERLENAYPIGRIGQPSEVADAVLFLAGKRASFVAGQHLVVDGGILSAGGWAPK